MVRFGSQSAGDIKRERARRVTVTCKKCGHIGSAWDGYNAWTCPRCSALTEREYKEFVPSWKHNALEALRRERKDEFTPPNAVRKIIKDIEDGLAEINDMLNEFDDSGSKRALMNAIYMFAALEKTYYDNEPYIEIFAYERYIRIKSTIIVTRNQLNDRMDKVG